MKNLYCLLCKRKLLLLRDTTLGLVGETYKCLPSGSSPKHLCELIVNDDIIIALRADLIINNIEYFIVYEQVFENNLRIYNRNYYTKNLNISNFIMLIDQFYNIPNIIEKYLKLKAFI